MNDPAERQPAPLREVPPADQFCDLVLNGGVASGVVYPWALLELARHYRFHSIGGNSVGAMAAALAAAAEYGRCNGVENAFEPLRRMPLELAKLDKAGEKTKMLRLFQPSEPVRRLFELFLEAVKWGNPEGRHAKSGWWAMLKRVLRVYGVWWPLLVLLSLLSAAVLLLTAWVVGKALGLGVWLLYLAPILLTLLLLALAVLLIAAHRFYKDLNALAGNSYGLCTGRSQVPDEEGLVEWLHRGVQLSAGRGQDDPPLTFADLWAAPRFGRAGPAAAPDGLQPEGSGIDLQMFCSNVTQGRPVRLPLNDANTRLYYDPDEWQAYFPDYVMAALNKASFPYVPASRSDPAHPDPSAPGATLDAKGGQLMASLRELPGGGMPLVVAARLSMSFPLLFSCVPVYAVDYEAPQEQRRLRRCLLSDGGLCTNFPIHLFDAAHPRWPTFALLLDSRLTRFNDQAVWRPNTHLEGKADNWHRFVPGAEDEGQPARPLLWRLLGLAGGIILTMKDWNDRVTGRLPHVRNRIIRLALQPGEGQLNLDMSRATILNMAHEYGTEAGKELVAAFAPDRNGVKPAWLEHVYVRSMVELRALRRHLQGYSRAAQSHGSTVPLGAVLDEATRQRPLAERDSRPDPTGARLSADQCKALGRAVQAVQALEAELSACEAQFGPYRPVVEPELRLRPPI